MGNEGDELSRTLLDSLDACLGESTTDKEDDAGEAVPKAPNAGEQAQASTLAVPDRSKDIVMDTSAVTTLAVRPDNKDEQEMWDWLEKMDGGKGAMLQYFGAIKSEFDADFSQILASRLASPVSPGALGSIEPSFFEALGVRPVGHRLLFARAILALP